MGNLTQLSTLYLGSNRLTGNIPAALGKRTNLTRLHLNDNKLSGPIPKELGKLSYLKHLYLDDNDLTGTIPAELGKIRKLRYLALSDNQLCGSYPDWWVRNGMSRDPRSLPACPTPTPTATPTSTSTSTPTPTDEFVHRAGQTATAEVEQTAAAVQTAVAATRIAEELERIRAGNPTATIERAARNYPRGGWLVCMPVAAMSVTSRFAMQPGCVGWRTLPPGLR